MAADASSSARRKGVISDILMHELATGFDVSHVVISPPIIPSALTDVHPEPVGTARFEDYVEETVPRYSNAQIKSHFPINLTSLQVCKHFSSVLNFRTDDRYRETVNKGDKEIVGKTYQTLKSKG